MNTNIDHTSIKDGLYRARFNSPLGEGAGVVVVNGQRFHGGDSGMAYVGTIAGQNGQIQANLKTFRHTQWPGGGSVLGNDDAQIPLTGKASEGEVTLANTSHGFKAVLTWMHD